MAQYVPVETGFHHLNMGQGHRPTLSDLTPDEAATVTTPEQLLVIKLKNFFL